MATNDTSLNQVGPIAGQLKQKLTSLEKTQIRAIRNLGGLSVEPGQITSSIAVAASQVNAQQRSLMELGANIAAKLESIGSFTKTNEQSLRPAITSTVYDKNPLAQRFPSNNKDLSAPIKRGSKSKSPSETIKDSKESLLGETDLNYEGLMFPSTLTQEAASFVLLHFQEYTRGDPQSAGSIAPGSVVYLPIPENLVTGYNLRFEERDTDGLGEIAKNAAVRNMVDAFKDNRLGQYLADMDKDDRKAASDLIRNVGQRAGFAALNSIDERLGGLVGQEAGMISNPLPTVFFKGIDLRSFTWTWKLVPKNQADAAAIKNILKIIRKNILPKKISGASTFLKYPNLVKPYILSGTGGDLDLYGKFKRSAVKEFLINFTAEGTSAYFHDGHPVAINCQMTFQEVENYTQEDA